MIVQPMIPHNHGKKRPEAKIQDALISYLRAREWFVKSTHGNAYQSGFPDLWACSTKYGHRWVEVKLPDMKGSRYTSAQLENFPKFCANGSGVWVLTAANDSEYAKLFKPANWWVYTGAMK